MKKFYAKKNNFWQNDSYVRVWIGFIDYWLIALFFVDFWFLA